jgi:hypothetical protein
MFIMFFWAIIFLSFLCISSRCTLVLLAPPIRRLQRSFGGSCGVPLPSASPLGFKLTIEHKNTHGVNFILRLYYI